MAGPSIRRSDRATKGQHHSRRSSEDATATKPAAAAAAAAKKAKGTSKTMGRPKKVPEPEQPVEEEDEDEDDDETIRCICGDNSDNGEKFIACEECDAWQHCICMGVALIRKLQPEHYYCEQCHPEDHPETVEAIAQGQKIWEERKENKGRRKSGRPPLTAASTQTSLTTEPKPNRDGRNTIEASPGADAAEKGSSTATTDEPKSAGSKRRHTEISSPTHPSIENDVDGVQTRRSSTVRADKRRKSSAKTEADAAPKPAEAPEPETEPMAFANLPKDRQNVVTAFIKTITDGIKKRCDAETFTLPSNETPESLGAHLSSLIEHELYKAHHDESSKTAYTNQFRQIIPNLKSNVALLDQILHHTLEPAKLAIMTSQEMASEEIQKRDAAMKEENDKQAILVRDDDDIKATEGKAEPNHGKEQNEERKEDQTTVKEGLGEIEMTTESAVQDAPAEPEPEPEPEPKSAKADDQVPSRPQTAAASRSPTNVVDAPAKEERRASQQQFDINSVWAKTQQSPVAESAPGQGLPGPVRPPPANPASQPVQQTEDADVDRLLADDNGDDDAAYATTDAATTTQKKIIWEGQLIQPGVCETTLVGSHMAGSDFSRFVPWDRFLPRRVEIEGRLQKATADDYLCGLEWSRKSDVSVLALTPRSQADRQRFDDIFNYFLSRDRYAVGKKSHGISEHVKDLYLTPVEANTEPPPFIGRLEYCDVDFPCPERILLATYVINKPAGWTNATSDGSATLGASFGTAAHNDTHRKSLPAPAGSPINPRSPVLDSPHQGASFASPTPSQVALHNNLMADSRISSILGQHVQSPVAQQIVTSAGLAIRDDMLMNVRDILDRNEQARHDMNAFQAEMVKSG